MLNISSSLCELAGCTRVLSSHRKRNDQIAGEMKHNSIVPEFPKGNHRFSFQLWSPNTLKTQSLGKLASIRGEQH